MPFVKMPDGVVYDIPESWGRQEFLSFMQENYPESGAQSLQNQEQIPLSEPVPYDSGSTIVNALGNAGSRAIGLIGEAIGAAPNISGAIERGINSILPQDALGIGAAMQEANPEAAAFLNQKGVIQQGTSMLGDAALGVRDFLTDYADNNRFKQAVTWDEVKQDPLSLKTIGFGAEQAVASAPDMLGAVFAAPAYLAARTSEIGQNRAENDGRQQLGVSDVGVGLVGAVVETSLERLATGSLLKGFLEPSKNAALNVGKQIGIQAGTEYLEEGSTYLAENLGTKKGATLEGFNDAGLQGAIGGAVMGGAVEGARVAGDLGLNALDRLAPTESIQGATGVDLLRDRANNPEAFEQFYGSMKNAPQMPQNDPTIDSLGLGDTNTPTNQSNASEDLSGAGNSSINDTTQVSQPEPKSVVSRSFASEREALLAANQLGIEAPIVEADGKGGFVYKAPQQQSAAELTGNDSLYNDDTEIDADYVNSVIGDIDLPDAMPEMTQAGQSNSTPAVSVPAAAAVPRNTKRPDSGWFSIANASQTPAGQTLGRAMEQYYQGRPEDYDNPATPEQVVFRPASGELGTISKALGVNVVEINGLDDRGFIDSTKSIPHGFFDSKTNTIFVNTASGSNPALTIFSHEFFHSLEKNAPERVAKFKSMIASYKQTPEWKAQREVLLDRGYDESVIDSEVSADSFAVVMTDPNFMKQLAKSQPSVFKGIVSKLKNLISQVKAMGAKAQAEEVRPLLKDYEALFQEALNVVRGVAQEVASDNLAMEQQNSVNRSAANTEQANPEVDLEAETAEWNMDDLSDEEMESLQAELEQELTPRSGRMSADDDVPFARGKKAKQNDKPAELTVTDVTPQDIIDAVKKTDEDEINLLAKQIDELGNVPTMSIKDLAGKKVAFIKADLTVAGGVFEGLDGVNMMIPQQGGPYYPALKKNQAMRLAWAFKSQAMANKALKAQAEADYIVVLSMKQDSHTTNATFTKALFKQMRGLIENGTVSKEQAAKLDQYIRAQEKPPTLDKNGKVKVDKQGNPKLGFNFKDFKGFSSGISEAFAYIDKLPFEQRGFLIKKLSAKGGVTGEIGMPSLIERLRSELVEKDFAGVDKGQALVVIKFDKDAAPVDLTDPNLNAVRHQSYDWALKGELIGKIDRPVRYQELVPNYYNKQRNTVDKSGQMQDDDAVWYRLDRDQFSEEVPADLPERLGDTPIQTISGLEARMVADLKADRWASTEQKVKDGGVSLQDFIDAIDSSPARTALSQYDPKELNKKLKEGFKVFQLSQGKLFFGLEPNYSYKEQYGFESPELTDNEVALVSVVNNERGVKGGSAAILIKALKEGATVLDAYAVKSKKYPKGFLPTLYADFGFKTVGFINFDERYVRDPEYGGSEEKFNELKNFWKQSGWNESKGYPQIAVMKWKGKESDREGIIKRYFESGTNGLLGRGSKKSVQDAETVISQRSGKQAERGAVSNQGRDTGPVRNGAGSSPVKSADRFAALANNLAKQTDFQLQQLGFTDQQIKDIRDEAEKSRVAFNRQDRGVPNQSGAGQVPTWGTPRQGAVTVEAVHYSKENRTELNGSKYGSGLKGAEKNRVDSHWDKRTKTRVYFYEEGTTPEAGVGTKAHRVTLTNIYDPATRLVPPQNTSNDFETAVLDEGFDGYIGYIGDKKAVVLMGKAAEAVPVLPVSFNRGNKTLEGVEPVLTPELERARALDYKQMIVKRDELKNTDKQAWADYKKEIEEVLTPERVQETLNLLGGNASMDELSAKYKLPENQRQKQNPELEKIVQDLINKRITREQYDELVLGARPMTYFDQVPELPSFERIVASIKSNQIATGVVGLTSDFNTGDKVALRLDIPAYEFYDTWVVSIHDGTKSGGDSLGYAQTGYITSVDFESSAKGALKIATGASKNTIARMYGDWVPHDPKALRDKAVQILDEQKRGIDNGWVQVGMNPYRASFFYEKKKNNDGTYSIVPVLKADEVIQIGSMVLARNPVRTTTTDPAFKTEFKMDNGEYNEEIFFNRAKRRTESEGRPIFATEKGIQNFWNWAGNIPLIDPTDFDQYEGGPAVFKLFHGTTYDKIETVDVDRGAKYGFMGAGFYLSNTIEDVNANYARVGPDLTAKIEMVSGMIMDQAYSDSDFMYELVEDYYSENFPDTEVTTENFEELFGDAELAITEEAARKQVVGDTDGLVMPVYAKFNNPFDAGSGKSEITVEKAREIIRAASDAAEFEYSGPFGVQAERLEDWILDNAEGMDEDGEGGTVDAKAFYNKFVSQPFDGVDPDDYDSSVGVGQLFKIGTMEAGFDGLIIDADEKFGSGRRRGMFFSGVPMAGVNPDTRHFMPYTQNQVKSVTGNNGDFSTEDNRITFNRAQTKTAEFRKWFKDSKVVDAKGEPMVLYHGSDGIRGSVGDGISEFKAGFSGAFGSGIYMTANPAVANRYAESDGNKDYNSPAVYAVYASIQKPLMQGAEVNAAALADTVFADIFDRTQQLRDTLTDEEIKKNGWASRSEMYDTLLEKRLKQEFSSIKKLFKLPESIKDFDDLGAFEGNVKVTDFALALAMESASDKPSLMKFIKQEFDGIIARTDRNGMEYVAFNPSQIKSATGNNGNFDASDDRIDFNRAQTKTAQFKQWFGSSVLVDEKREPIVLYTGTSKDVDFDKFKIPKNGAWFTTSPEAASMYAKENDSQDSKYNPETRRYEEINTASRVMPVYLKIEKPYKPTAEEMQEMVQASNYKRVQSIVFERAKARGFDGVDMGDGIWVVIRSANQIKSAIGNNGDFSTTKDKIQFNRAQTKTNEFKRWFKESMVVDSNREPLVVYHGSYSDFDKFKPTKGAHLGFHFGDREAAQTRLEDTAEGRIDQAEVNRLNARSEQLYKRLSAFEEKLRRKEPDIPEEEIAKAVATGGDVLSLLERFKYKPTKEEQLQLQTLKNEYERSRLPINKTGIGGQIGAYYLSAQKLLRMPDVGNWGNVKAIQKALPWDSESKTLKELAAEIKSRGYDGIVYANQVETPVMRTDSYIVFSPNQIKSAMGNNGEFNTSDDRVQFNRTPQAQNASGNRVQINNQSRKLVFGAQSKVDREVFTKLSDKFLRLEEVQARVAKEGFNTTDAFGKEVNPYAKQERFAGRRAELRSDFLDNEVTPILDSLEKNNLDIDRVMLLMYAQHAAERNAAMFARNKKGGPSQSGMSNSAAYALLNGNKGTVWVDMVDEKTGVSSRRKLEFDGFTAAEIAQLTPYTTQVKNIIEGTRQLLVNSGLETKDQMDVFRNAYQNYIPLADTEDMADASVGRGVASGFSVRGSTIKMSLGRQNFARDIFGQIVMTREAAIDRQMKNDVLKEVVAWNTALARQGVKLEDANGTPLFEVNPTDMVRFFRSGRLSDYASEASAALGIPVDKLTPDQIRQSINDRVFGGNASQARIDAYVKMNKGTVVNMSKEVQFADNTSVLRVDGKDVLIRWNDEALARAFRNIGANEATLIGSETLRPMTNYFRNIYTAYNPYFWAKNFLRDLGATAFGANQLGDKGTRMFLSNIGRGIREAFNAEYRQGSAEWDAFRLSGARTGFVTSFRNARERQAELLKQHQRSGGAIKMTTGFFKKLTDYILGVNSVMEDGIRFAVWKAAKDKGMTDEQAADKVRQISVNFNRKGEMSDALNSYYVFFNAAVQGARTTKRALQSPKGKKAAAVLVGFSTVLNMFAALALGEDEDGEALWNTDAVRADRMNNILIPTFNKERPYIKIPLQYGLNAVWNMGAVLPAMWVSDNPLKQAVLESVQVGKGVVDGFAPPPVGSAAKVFSSTGEVTTAAMIGITPTPLQPVAQIAMNVNGFGNQIRPNNGGPANQDMYKSTRGSGYDNFIQSINEALGGTPNNPRVPISPEDLKNTLSLLFGSFNATAISMFAEPKNGRERGVLDNKFLSGFVANPDMLEGDDLKRFYEAEREIKALASDEKYYQADGNDAKRDAILDNPLWGMRSQAGFIRKRLGELRDDQLEILNDPSIPKEERAQLLRDIEAEKQERVDEFNREYRLLKKNGGQ